MNPSVIEAVKQRILDVKSGHEWAFFNGTADLDCPLVVARVRELEWLLVGHDA